MSHRYLLACDLDRTLLPNGIQAESSQARPLFQALVARPEVALAYVSGRDQRLVEVAIEQYLLPSPDWVISDVGTNIYQIEADVWRVNTIWHTQIAPDWSGSSGADIAALLNDISDLCLQEPEKQNEYKLSYYLAHDHGYRDLLERLHQRLHQAGIRSNLVWSVDETSNTGLLDIIPKSADKLRALRFLLQTLAIPVANTLYAGDSGNDLPVLTSEIPAVLVANAHEDVRREAELFAKQRGNESSLYHARGGFLEMNGNYAAGILEGVQHFLPQLLRD
jgi:sucrose-6-phosphatase